MEEVVKAHFTQRPLSKPLSFIHFML